jgi:hypothetical protein
MGAIERYCHQSTLDSGHRRWTAIRFDPRRWPHRRFPLAPSALPVARGDKNRTAMAGFQDNAENFTSLFFLHFSLDIRIN